MYPNFGTPKIINFPFGTNGKFIIFRCPNMFQMENLLFFGVPILKHIMVVSLV